MTVNSTGHLELPPFYPLHTKEWQVGKARQPRKIRRAAFECNLISGFPGVIKFMRKEWPVS